MRTLPIFSPALEPGVTENTLSLLQHLPFSLFLLTLHVVGPCHHGMARPHVADRGTASDKEGSCE